MRGKYSETTGLLIKCTYARMWKRKMELDLSYLKASIAAEKKSVSKKTQNRFNFLLIKNIVEN
jgi:hypothetical protein